jgi:hypothetical protein
LRCNPAFGSSPRIVVSRHRREKQGGQREVTPVNGTNTTMQPMQTPPCASQPGRAFPE